MIVNSPFAGARKMKPTKKHRLAIWENMLGTVYAMSADGTVRYFDYAWEEARAFAGVVPGSDLRTWRYPYPTQHLRRRQTALYVKDEERNQDD